MTGSVYAPRRRRWPVVLLVLVLIVVVLVVVADRIGAGVAGDRIDEQLTTELAGRGVSTEDVEVSVDGFPFLTQVLRGRYDKITIELTEVRAEEARLPQLVVVANGVHAKAADLISGTARVTADTVTGAGTIDWESLGVLVNQRADLPVSDVRFAPVGDLIQAKGVVMEGDVRVPLTATASVELAGDTVKIRLSSAEIDGVELPASVRAAVTQAVRGFAVSVAIPPLPFDLTIDRLEVAESGLRVAATARNVLLAG